MLGTAPGDVRPSLPHSILAKPGRESHGAGTPGGRSSLHHPRSPKERGRKEVAMQAMQHTGSSERYARCVEVSKRIRWEIDRDVFRGRTFDYAKKFLPDGLSKVNELEFLDAGERRLLSQVQGRTYANLFGLIERYIAAKVLELSRGHWLGDQTALEALVRFTDEELKHQELFRRMEAMIASGMPVGYGFLPRP